MIKIHVIHGSHGSEICKIEENENQPYIFPAKNVKELDQEVNGFCSLPGDKVFMGTLGGQHSPEYQIYWNEDSFGQRTVFQNTEHLRYWYADRWQAFQEISA